MKHSKGVSVVELLVSISIISIVVAVLFNLFSEARQDTLENDQKTGFNLTQSSIVNSIEQDIINYGLKTVEACNINTFTSNAITDAKSKCVKLTYSSEHLNDNIAYIGIYKTYKSYVANSSTMVGNEDTTTWVIAYQRVYSNDGLTWVPTKTNMRELPEEVLMDINPYVTYSRGTNGAVSIVIPLSSKTGKRYDISLSYVGNTTDKTKFKCRPTTNSVIGSLVCNPTVPEDFDEITCMPGEYSDGTTCHTCEEGYYCPNGDETKIKCPSGTTSKAGSTKASDCIEGAEDIGKSWEYNYKGAEETFVVPYDGVYNLSVKGGKGGSASYYYDLAGAGCVPAYSLSDSDRANSARSAQFSLKKGTILYIQVGGGGGSGVAVADSCEGRVSTRTGAAGYNGGLKGGTGGSGSGGCTTVSLQTGTLTTDLKNSGNILISASGGSGYWKGSGDYKNGQKSGCSYNYINESSTSYIQTTTTPTSEKGESSKVRITLVSLT